MGSLGRRNDLPHQKANRDAAFLTHHTPTTNSETFSIRSPWQFRAHASTTESDAGEVMPRRRSLSPEFFKDEDLACLPFEARLLFQGLWCYADRDGRLEDRPKYLKAELFAYDRVDVDKLLSLLAHPSISDRPAKAFIRRYTVESRQYIEIIEFVKHQTPHPHESSGHFPEPAVTCNYTPLHVIASNDKPTLPVYIDQGPVKGPVTKDQKGKKRALPLPENFGVSLAVAVWAKEKGFDRLELRLEHFKDTAMAKGYIYVDWDAAFRKAIRDDWAKLREAAIDPPGEFDHLPKLNNDDYWICGCPKADTGSTCRHWSHGMTREESYHALESGQVQR